MGTVTLYVWWEHPDNPLYIPLSINGVPQPTEFVSTRHGIQPTGLKFGYFIHRFASRGKIDNFIDRIEIVWQDGSSELVPMTEESGKGVLQKLRKGWRIPVHLFLMNQASVSIPFR